jgi:hypothetical protein
VSVYACSFLQTTFHRQIHILFFMTELNFFSGDSLVSMGSAAGSRSVAVLDGARCSVTITVNGVGVVIPAPAGRIEIRDGKLWRNGELYDHECNRVIRDDVPIEIKVTGDVGGDVTSSSGAITIHGTVDGNAGSSTGNVTVTGNVGGSATSMTGNVNVGGTVAGTVTSTTGNVDARRYSSGSGGGGKRTRLS